MNKITFLFLLELLFHFTGYSQITFENGYYITNSNRRVDCQIKYVDWKNTPESFNFRIDEGSAVQKAAIDSVKEFGKEGVFKFIRAKVEMDRSTDIMSKLGSNRNPVFNQEQLFLKVLQEGSASLYYYEEGNLTRYFYRVNDSEIKQLVYKRYVSQVKTVKNNYYQTSQKVLTNNYYQQQLYMDLACESIKQSEIERLDYEEKALVKFFTTYNHCKNPDFKAVSDKPENRDFFNLSLRVGMNLVDFALENSANHIFDTDFGTSTNIRLSMDAEYILPTNKNKWGVWFEPSYYTHNASLTSENSKVSGGKLISDMEINVYEFNFGLRYYMFITGRSKFFTNIGYVRTVTPDSRVEFLRTDGSNIITLEVHSNDAGTLGVGYNYNNKLSFEARYYLNRSLLIDYSYYISNFETLSFVIGYNFFK